VGKEYSAKLRDPRWQKMRLQVLERDEWACQACFDTSSTLHVHHLFYLPGKQPWEYDLAALVTLCESCHETETFEFPRVADDLIHSLKLAGLLTSEVEELCTALHPLDARVLHPASWSAIVFGIRELVMDAYHNKDEHLALRLRYQESLKGEK
jgi:hypothetical protein